MVFLIESDEVTALWLSALSVCLGLSTMLPHMASRSSHWVSICVTVQGWVAVILMSWLRLVAVIIVLAPLLNLITAAQQYTFCVVFRFLLLANIKNASHPLSAGPGAGVGRGGGGRGGVWRHAAPGARGATALGRLGPVHRFQLHPVPHGEGAAAEGCHPGAAAQPPAGRQAAGTRLPASLPVHLQGLHLHRDPRWIAVSEVRGEVGANARLVINWDYQVEGKIVSLAGLVPDNAPVHMK